MSDPDKITRSFSSSDTFAEDYCLFGEQTEIGKFPFGKPTAFVNKFPLIHKHLGKIILCQEEDGTCSLYGHTKLFHHLCDSDDALISLQCMMHSSLRNNFGFNHKHSDIPHQGILVHKGWVACFEDEVFVGCGLDNDPTPMDINAVKLCLSKVSIHMKRGKIPICQIHDADNIPLRRKPPQ